MGASVIWSGNSSSAGRNSGPGTGVAYGDNASVKTHYAPSHMPQAVNAGTLPSYLSDFGAIAHGGNNLIGQNVSFDSFDDVFKTISSILQNTFGGSAQSFNNQNYRQLMQEQNEYNTNSANKAMKFSREMAERQMDFQQYNADTSYQRAVKDLKAAGLNPVLAAFNGGSPSPSGSSANGIAAHSAQAGYDDGYNGITQIATSLISNLPMMTIASALNGSGNLKKLINTTSGLVDNIAGFVDGVLNPRTGEKKSSFNQPLKWSDVFFMDKDEFNSKYYGKKAGIATGGGYSGGTR